jgi:hypothetical protein
MHLLRQSLLDFEPLFQDLRQLVDPTLQFDLFFLCPFTLNSWNLPLHLVNLEIRVVQKLHLSL